MKTGRNVKISPRVSIYNGDMIEIGDNVRIDDFCVLSGGAGLKIGSHVHIACYGVLFAGAGIEIEDFAQFAARVTILSKCDDFSGHSLVGPQVPEEFKPRLKSGLVRICRHTVLGVNTTVMPGVTIKDGVAVGAYSFVKDDLEVWGIYAGVPAKRIGERSKEMLRLEKKLFAEYEVTVDGLCHKESIA